MFLTVSISRLSSDFIATEISDMVMLLIYEDNQAGAGFLLGGEMARDTV